ncbi:unnamed protein product [Brassica napus]|uniref:(rape) hypothetical protein n=1 Tax=Brassica napus TaxID=3708 RepID=A0A816QV13_BRANA|nr:unnamed protein product [Brassica napus]
MHTILHRRFVVFGSCSWQLTKSLMMKKKPTFSYTSHSHHNHFLSHLLPSGIASSSSEIDGFFASTLRRNTHLKLKPGSFLESRAGFFDPQLPPKPWGFTGFQKRRWKSWFNAANGVVLRLILANVAVFTMWKNSNRKWMARNFVLSSYTFMSGRTHTLITSGFRNVGTSQLIVNMIGLYYFGTSIARTLGPVDLLKLYFAGSLAGSVLFISVHGVMAIPFFFLRSFIQGSIKTKPFISGKFLIHPLLDIFLYPKVTTYFAFIFRVPVMIGILGLGQDLLKVLENFPALSQPKRKNLSFFSQETMRWERVRRQNQQVGLGDSSSGPGKRWGHTCNAIKGGRFVYVFGGFGRDDCLTNQVNVFDAGTQIWTKPVIRGVPPSPRDSHSCTTVGDHLFVFGGTDGKNHLKDLHVLDTSSHTWKCVDARGEGPEAREAHSATLVGKRIFIFGGCGKASGSDDEVFYNDLFILNTETLTWQRAETTGNPPSARDSHTCSAWKNKIIVVGGEDLDDYYYSDVHILDTETFVWKQMKTLGQVLTPRAGHVTVALERNLFVFGGFTDSQNLYDDLYVLDVETGVWSKLVHAIEEGPSARFSAGAVSLGPYKAGSFFFLGGCSKNLEPLDDIYYLHTDGGYNARFDQTPGRFSIRKQMKLKCQAQKLAVAGTSTNQGVGNLPMSIGIGLIDQRKTVFHARVTENVPLGYSIETIIDGKVLRGFLFSNRHSSGQTADSSVSSGKRPAMLDADCDHGAKSQRILSEDAAGSSQQAGSVDPSDDANKKVTDSDVMDTSMIDTADANVNIVRPQEAETAAVASDVKDQDPSQLNMDAVNAEPSPVTLDQGNVEPLRNETSTDVGAATEAGPRGDSSPQNQDEGTVAAEDADADQKPQPH